MKLIDRKRNDSRFKFSPGYIDKKETESVAQKQKYSNECEFELIEGSINYRLSLTHFPDSCVVIAMYIGGVSPSRGASLLVCDHRLSGVLHSVLFCLLLRVGPSDANFLPLDQLWSYNWLPSGLSCPRKTSRSLRVFEGARSSLLVLDSSLYDRYTSRWDIHLSTNIEPVQSNAQPAILQRLTAVVRSPSGICTYHPKTEQLRHRRSIKKIYSTYHYDDRDHRSIRRLSMVIFMPSTTTNPSIFPLDFPSSTSPSIKMSLWALR